VATILAGLSSGAMTRSQYYRSLAAQDQAKASDQWGYYQAKKMRSVNAGNTMDLLAATGIVGSLDPQELRSLSGKIAAAVHSDAANELDARMKTLLGDEKSVMAFAGVEGKLPAVVDQTIEEVPVRDAMRAIAMGATDADLAGLMRQIKGSDLVDATATANGNLTHFDEAVKPIGDVLDGLHTTLAELREVVESKQGPLDAAAGTNPAELLTDLTTAQASVDAARLRFEMARYQREAEYNGSVAAILEVEIRQAGAISDRDRKRSGNFFYGMLAAQAGVTIATLAMAVKQKNLFWSLAAMAGAVAVAFSGYIYMFT